MKKLIPLMVLMLLSILKLWAQEGKLKNVQTASVYAPANLKVDGKLNEWDDNFQAYNKTTQIFYTVCNDDKYLYLVIKSIDQTNNNKIIAGGISFIINTDGKKKEKNAFTVTFPVIPRTPRQRGGGRGGAGGGRAAFGGGGFGRGGQAPDSAAIAYAHQQTIEKAKEIGVLGFKDITDSLISIYNEYSIKAALGYDAINNYDYELAIPLKLLNLSPGDNKEIAYDIKVNGLPMPQGFGGDNTRGGGIDGGEGGGAGGAGGAGGGFGGGGGRGGAGGGGGGRGGAGGGGGGNRGGGNNPGGQNLDMFASTDFWGKYVLAKK